LRSLFFDECRLHRVGLFWRAEPFNRRYGFAGGLPDSRGAGARNLTINQDAARTALAKTAAKFRTMQSAAIAQYVHKRLSGIPRIDGDRLPSNTQTVFRHRVSLAGNDTPGLT